MESNKPHLGYIVALILMFASLFLANIFNVIPDDLYTRLGSAISYKVLINFVFFLLALIALIFVYYKNVRKEQNNTISENIDSARKVELTKKEIDENYKFLLSNLSKEEKAILSEYIDNDTKTNYYNINDGVIGGLVSTQILYRSTNISQMGSVFSYNIQPWAWEMLRKNPKYLKI